MHCQGNAAAQTDGHNLCACPIYLPRSTGGNACRQGAYIAREKVLCEQTGEVLDFRHKASDLVALEIMLPEVRNR